MAIDNQVVHFDQVQKSLFWGPAIGLYVTIGTLTYLGTPCDITVTYLVDLME